MLSALKAIGKQFPLHNRKLKYSPQFYNHYKAALWEIYSKVIRAYLQLIKVKFNLINELKYWTFNHKGPLQ